MRGTLFVVATPIGNLEDLSPRAARVMAEVAVVAAEDTRHTARLLHRQQIAARTLSFHEHNERQRIPALIERLEAGEHVALVSDAGTPGISDPGFRLVRAVIDAGIRVEPVPGPSALVAALVVSGLPTDGFVFEGFAPPRQAARRAWLGRLAAESRTIVYYEAPHRLRESLEDLRESMGERQVAVARELTKVHEEVIRGTVSEVLGALTVVRGEITVVVAGRSDGPSNEELPADDALMAEFGQLTKKEGLGRRAAITFLARRYGVGSRTVYAALERARDSAE